MKYDNFDPTISATTAARNAPVAPPRLNLASAMQTASAHHEQLQQVESRLWSLLEAIGGPQPPRAGGCCENDTDCLGIVDRIHDTQASQAESISNIHALITKIEEVIR